MKETVLLQEYIDIYVSAIKYIEDLVSKPTQEYGLSFEQFLILQEINTDSSISLKDIAAKRHVTRGAISRQAGVLIKNNYIKQEIDPEDRRRMILHLTETGRKVVDDLLPKIKTRFESWIDAFGEDKAREMLNLMNEFKQKVMIDAGEL
ncbi:MarR family transcriptional regulator [Companilactobacillus sp. RD055328]|uniref:MarR family winged helix-turn-helix transcriptional regulator n=1 Tax=Companilactobacillus sp. RD055328 TaxID=2916634 RepID=UPI001FC7D0AD|nr:MarR family transcriptional regulator [Companilactobacillus sp. RD055328]GKQ42439.1 MarR family transcriptional regulator [Companilactobacillus sp. RD055328]